MKKAELLFGLFLLIFTIFMLLEGIQYSYTSDFGPGPGFAPVWLSSLMILCIVILLLKNIKLKNKETFFVSRIGVSKAITYMVLLVISTLLVPITGLILSLTVFSFVILKFVEKFSFKSSILVSLGTMSFILIVFNFWLEINLPTGYFIF
ncbi:tripartite tricarboxylate transporter TctB family protein [Oceanobacillus jeddahense]|uniref:tripartite tricarboxylate transporter TctB family protein n=1 Tax=Oceanobacillus jeddahense TaxID=1462527 RepID=UPI000595F44C|nr:tripartite tricarboxylate transporter TctB family protein [Oceanobacillus jeddahense]